MYQLSLLSFGTPAGCATGLFGSLCGGLMMGGILAASPALAFDPSGNAVADRFLEIMEAGDATVNGYDGVTESGGTVTITGLRTTITSEGAPAELAVATTAISGGTLRDDGGLGATRMTMSGVTVDGKDGDEEVRITVETIAIDDPLLPSAASVRLTPDASGVAPGYSRAELNGMLIDAKGQGRIPIARVVARIDRMDGDMPTAGSVELDGLKISQELLDEDEKKTLADLGYQDLLLSGSFEADWDPASGRLDVTRITFGGDTAARMQAALAIGGLTREVVEKLDQSQDNPEQAMALMQGLTLERLSLRLDNDSLVDRLLDSQARASGQTREAFVGNLTGALPMMLSIVGNPEFQAKVASAATTFLKEPRSFSAVAAPASPLPFAQVMGMAMMAPQMLPDLLNVSVEANTAAQ